MPASSCYESPMKKIKAFLAGSLRSLRSGPAQARTQSLCQKGSSVKLGISSYSYWHFRPPKVTIEQVIEKTSALAFPGSISFIGRWTARTPPICANSSAMPS